MHYTIHGRLRVFLKQIFVQFTNGDIYKNCSRIWKFTSCNGSRVDFDCLGQVRNGLLTVLTVGQHYTNLIIDILDGVAESQLQGLGYLQPERECILHFALTFRDLLGIKIILPNPVVDQSLDCFDQIGLF